VKGAFLIYNYELEELAGYSNSSINREMAPIDKNLKITL
jgi:hypothetical protein